MSVNRRNFIGGSALALTGAWVSGTTQAGTGGLGPLQAQKGASSMPFVESRGGRSADPAVATQALAEHCVSVKFSDLDAQTLRKAKHRILDLVGCVIGGAPAAGNAAMVDMVREEAGPADASIIGYPLKASASQAAMVNATLARSYDFEVMTVAVGDKYIGSHHSPTTSMTTLALCEKGQLSGKDFVTALVVGDDMAARILAASGLDLSLGWDGAAVYPAIPAAAIASRLMGLTAQQAQDAFGITLDTIAGTNQNTWDGVTHWKLQQGQAARNGIMAASLAKRGWVGVRDALLAPYGLYAQFTPGCEHPDILTERLGEVFYGEEYFKPYPVCGGVHASLECALAMSTNNKLDPGQIRQAILRVPGPSLSSVLAKPFVAGRYPHCEAVFSIHFQVANALLQGDIRQEHYDDAYLRGAELAAMLGKVSLAALPEGRKAGEVELEVITTDGRTLVERHNGTPWQHPSVNPSTYEQIVAKFRQQVAFSGFVSPQVADEIIHRVANIEQEANMAEFVQLLTRSYLV